MSAVIFTLSTPLASWAESGVSYRPSDFVPTWSALVGLVGAAFGWPRGDERLVRFATEFAPAFEVVRTGDRLVDFQTIQSPGRAVFKNKAPRTRHQEVDVAKEQGKLHTTITKREYVQDSVYKIALASLVEKPFIGMKDIIDALASPVFPLYAGRRSCPLGHVAAELSDGDAVNEWLPNVTHWDTRLVCEIEPSLTRERRDLLVKSAEPRRFSIRTEAIR